MTLIIWLQKRSSVLFLVILTEVKTFDQAMVQNNITVTEGDDAGPPPNIQIPLNIRQIINEENNKYNMHTLARSPFYRRHDGKKTRRYPVPVRDRNKHQLWTIIYGLSSFELKFVIAF